MINPHMHNIKGTIFNMQREFEEIKNRTPRGLVEAAMLIRGNAQDRCPVDTGNLKASAYVVWKKGYKRTGRWSKRKSKYDGRPKDLGRLKRDHAKITADHEKLVSWGDVVIGFSAWYAMYVHQGTQKQRARPFLRKAMRDKRQEAIEIVRKTAAGKK